MRLGDPRIQNGSDSCCVRHSEFIADVVGSIAFAATAYAINPAVSGTFAWLSSIAIRYERYQFRRLSFHYEPRCSTATPGTVILAIDYDALDPAPETKQTVLSYHNKGDSSAWQPCATALDVGTSRNRGSLFTRAGVLGANQDLKTYDLGNLYVCTAGHAGATVCGELYVDYEVDLMIPQIEDSLIAGHFEAHAGLAAASLVGTDWAGGNILENLIDVTATSASTLTFNQDWEGVLSLFITGTVMSGNVADAGTAAYTLRSNTTYNAGATQGRTVATVRALRGETLVLSITATTVTDVHWYLTPANLA